MIIRVDKPTLRRKDMDAVLQTMADEQIGPGQHTEAFMDMFRQYVGTEGKTVVVRTYMDALVAAIRSLNLPLGSSIAVSALSPSIYRYAIGICGCEALIVDIDAENGNMSYARLASMDEGQPSAIIMYEPYGNLPSDEPWESLGIPIIEDVTEALGSEYGERLPGKLGQVILCAFEESCVVSTGGGAAIHVHDAASAQQLSSYIDPLQPYITLPSMNAALGVIQFQHLAHDLARRRAIHERFRQALMRTKHQFFGIRDIDFLPNGHGFVVVVDAKPSEARKFALNYEVGTEMAFSRTVIDDSLDRFDLYPVAIPCILRAIRFPLYPFLTNQQVSQIEKVISHLP